MDYRKFLGKVDSEVLPYWGGASVDTASRRLRVATPPAPGWWRFDVQGRTATAREPAEPSGLDGLPCVRGHLWGTRLVREGAVAEPVHLLPDEEPPRFSPVRARRWHDGSLLFEQLEFEGEAEDAARRVLEGGGSLSEVKAVPASLRAAFGYTLLERASRALDIPFSPAETRGQVLRVSEGGRACAEARLRELAAERAVHVAAVEARLRAQEWQHRREVGEARLQAELALLRARPRSGERRGEGAVRVDRALESAGARLLDFRRLGSGRLEVTFGFLGERFLSIVEEATLQVVDAGICLAGADRQVTLDSLPSVIREAIENDVLVITRHV